MHVPDDEIVCSLHFLTIVLVLRAPAMASPETTKKSKALTPIFTCENHLLGACCQSSSKASVVLASINLDLDFILTPILASVTSIYWIDLSINS